MDARVNCIPTQERGNEVRKCTFKDNVKDENKER
jgi:hypothetical protein